MRKGAQVADKISTTSTADVGTVAVIIMSGLLGPDLPFSHSQADVRFKHSTTSDTKPAY